jgi:rhamnose transport system permease protein
MLQQSLAPGAKSMQGGRLGPLDVRGSEIILGAPLKFTRANIDKFDF